MSAPAVLLPGTRLGKYELLRALAVGGMAEIHLARVKGLEGFSKLVVVKRILPQLAIDDAFVRLFLDEARLAATLHHPNIVEVFDVGIEDGSYFMAMEYVRGENLAQVIAAAIKNGRGLSLGSALTVIAGVAEGLHHAHEQRGGDGVSLGIVHRDVSPSNVLVTYEGRVKVCDFGIAKVAARGHTTSLPRGKLAYMSPEQVRGEPVDRRSDVFAIGIMLYELTTGRRLFRGSSDHEVGHKICDEDVPAPTSVRPDYSPGLERIVLRALRRDPAERHATAQELQLEIEELARAEQLVMSPVALARFLRELFGEPRIEDASDETTANAAPASAAPASATPPRKSARITLGRALIAVAASAVIAAATIVLFAGSRRAQGTPTPSITSPQPTSTPTSTVAPVVTAPAGTDTAISKPASSAPLPGPARSIAKATRVRGHDIPAPASSNDISPPSPPDDVPAPASSSSPDPVVPTTPTPASGSQRPPLQ